MQGIGWAPVTDVGSLDKTRALAQCHSSDRPGGVAAHTARQPTYFSLLTAATHSCWRTANASNTGTRFNIAGSKAQLFRIGSRFVASATLGGAATFVPGRIDGGAVVAPYAYNPVGIAFAMAAPHGSVDKSAAGSPWRTTGRLTADLVIAPDHHPGRPSATTPKCQNCRVSVTPLVRRRSERLGLCVRHVVSRHLPFTRASRAVSASGVSSSRGLCTNDRESVGAGDGDVQRVDVVQQRDSAVGRQRWRSSCSRSRRASACTGSCRWCRPCLWQRLP